MVDRDTINIEIFARKIKRLRAYFEAQFRASEPLVNKKSIFV
jgi:hypothetical protein